MITTARDEQFGKFSMNENLSDRTRVVRWLPDWQTNAIPTADSVDGLQSFVVIKFSWIFNFCQISTTFTNECG